MIPPHTHFFFLPCVGTAIYKQGSGVSPGAKLARNLSMDFPASGTIRNKFLLFKSPHLLYFVIVAQAD